MQPCIIQLNNDQKDLLRGRLAMSDFAYELRDYYQGLSKDAPDISVLGEFMNDKTIPRYFKGNFTPQDLVDFLHDPTNASKLTEAIGSMLSSINLTNPKGLNHPDYVKDPGTILKSLREDANNRLGNDEKQHINDTEREQLEDSAEKGLMNYDDYKHQFLKKYNSIEAYRIGRFKGSATTEIHVISKFINDVLIKNALIDVEKKELISTKQISGVFGKEGAPIDFNLKEYRKSLMRDLIQRLDLHEPKGDKSVKIDHTQDDLFEKSRFQDINKLIEQSVGTVRYKGENTLLSDEGVLVEIANELKKTNDPKLQSIIDNYVDHVILTDYNKLFDYYAEGVLKVADYNDDFDNSSVKYGIGKISTIEEANVNWTDKIHNALDLSPELYKTVMEVTPMLSYTTGEPLNDYMYSALVAEVMSKYEPEIDPAKGEKSIKKVLIKALTDPNNSFLQKNVLYTMYKKFFEQPGDKSVQTPKSNTNKTVASWLDTISRYNDKSLLHVVVKPLQETKKVFYAEVTEVGREPAIVQSGTRDRTVTLTNVVNDITGAINKPDIEALDSLIDKYGLKFNTGSISYKTPNTDSIYELKPIGTTAYDKNTLMTLSRDLLGIDFEENNAHREFLQDLESRATGSGQIANSYLAFLHDALRVFQARKMLFDPEVQKLIEEKGSNAVISGSDVLTSELKRDKFNISDPTSNTIPVRTIAANNVYEMLSDAENRYAGNRIKKTVRTPEGTTVAGFSAHTLFLGLKQTHQAIRDHLSSVDTNSDARLPMKELAFIKDPNLLVRFEVKSATKIGATVKSNPEMNEVETFTYNMDLGYFDRMSRNIQTNKPVTPMFDSLTYSDKTTIYAPVVANTFLGQKIFIDGNYAVPEDVTRKLHFDTVGSYYRAYGNNILDTWRKIYTQVGINGEYALMLDNILSPIKTISGKLAKLNEINSTLWNDSEKFEHGLTGFKAARFYADKAGVALNNWVHYQHNRKTMVGENPPLIVKSSLIKYMSLYDSPTDRKAYDEFMNKHLIDSINEHKGIGYTFGPQASKAILGMYPALSKQFRNDAGQVFLTANNKSASKVEHVNPAFRKYFNDFNFVSENIKLSSIGTEFSHKGDSPFAVWTAQNKRNVMATASMRKYTLGLENGVENSTRTAFMDDFETPLKTILGEIHKVVDLDGSSLETVTQRLKTKNSLNSKYGSDGGPDHKSIFTHINPNSGETGLTKHAAFVMDYDMIRNSIGSDVDLMELHKKLYSTDISKVDITKSYNKDINLSYFQNEPIHYWDRTYDYDKGLAGYIYKLESIEHTGKDVHTGDSTYTVKTRNLSLAPNDVITTKNQRINTMFDLWKVLGHIDSVEPTTEKTGISYLQGKEMKYFKPSETSAEHLLNYESYMGNGGEKMLPIQYITGGNKKSTVEGWNIYKKLFNTEGVVDSHISLIKDYLDQDSTKFEVQKQLAEELVKYDTKVTPVEFLQIVKNGKKPLVEFLNSTSLPKARVAGRVEFDPEDAVNYQRFKGKNIDRITFAGAQKLGQFNMNDLSTISRKHFLANGHAADAMIPGVTHLLTHQISNLNGGVQLNAWHEAEESTVTAPTQMLNALIFNGKSIEDVSDIYRAIGDLVEANLDYVFEDPDIPGKQRVNIPETVRNLSKVYADNKDVLLRVFHDMMKKSVKDNDFTLESTIKKTFSHANLPIDDTHLFQSGVADLANYFTKNGIRINFDGIFSVLAPSNGMLQFHDVKGGYLPVKEANGSLSYRKLDDNKVTTLNREDFENYVNYQKHLQAHPEKTGSDIASALQFNDEGDTIEATLNGEHAGRIGVAKRGKGEYFVSSVRVPEHLRNQGVGTELYKQAIIKAQANKGYLLPDLGSSEGAYKVWQNLEKQGFAKINSAELREGHNDFWALDARSTDKSPLDVKSEKSKVNLGEIIDGSPRDLRGQQVTLEYANGKVVPLSVLRKGEEHLIPEAEALSKVKDLISTYKSVIGSPGYDKLSPKEKMQELTDGFDAFKEEFSYIADERAKSREYDPRVGHVFKSLTRDYMDIDPEAVNATHFVDYLYDKFGANKEYRMQINAGYEAKGDMKNLALSHEYDYLDRLNQVGKAYLSKLQGFLDEAALGVIPASLTNASLFSYQDGLNTAKVKISRAEVIAPLTAKASFLLRSGDNIGDVDEHFFLKRLQEKLNYFDVDADAVLLSKFGRRTFLHAGRFPKNQIETTNTRDIDGTIWYTNEHAEPQFIIPKGVTLTEIGGEMHAWVKDEVSAKTLRSVLNQTYKQEGDSFKEPRRLGVTPQEKAQYKAEALEEATHKAKMMWNSWQKYLNVIGTRIPGQHFQSFQGLKIIGFTDGNRIHVPNEITLLSGSDFDIDKQNVIYHSVNKDGTIALWHPAARYDTIENIEKSMQLPLQRRRHADDFIARSDSGGNLMDAVAPRITDDADMTDLDTLLLVYKQLKDGFRFTMDQHPNIIANLVHYDNFTEGSINPEDPYANEVHTLNNGVKGIKNFAISRTNNTIENPANFIYLSKPVSMETPALFADNSPKGEAAKRSDPHKPNSIVSAKLDNMVGKKVIGIMATGLKVFSAVSLTYNNELRRLAPVVNEYKRLQQELLKAKVDPIANHDVIQGLMSDLAKNNLLIDRVTKAIQLDKLPLIAQRQESGLGIMHLLPNLNYDKISSDVLQEVFRRMMDAPEVTDSEESSANALLLKKYLTVKGSFEDDAAEIMSQLLSAATDNAKELILGKINASPDLAGMYATMLMLNIPFEQIVRTMTSDFTEMVIRKGTPNVFNRKSVNNTISDLLTNMANAYSEKDKKLAYGATKNLKERYDVVLEHSVGTDTWENAVTSSGPMSESAGIKRKFSSGFRDTSTSQKFTLEDVKSLRVISDTAKEVSLLGRMLSINQGVKSNSWDLYKFKTGIEDHMRKLNIPLDFKRFLDSLSGDHSYANSMIDEVSQKRSAFNILYVLATNPHFAEQLKAYNAAQTMLELSSYKVNTMFNIVQKLRDINYLGTTQSFTKEQFQDTEKFIENTVLENFIDQETQRPRNLLSSPIFYDGDQEIRINTTAGQIRFAKWVREVFEPRLKAEQAYRGNDFVQGITIDTKPDQVLNDKFSFIKLKVDTTNAQSIIQKGNKESYTYGLRRLYNTNATDFQHEDADKQNNIVNTLFWYNLLVNKSGITKNSYAKMLGEVMGLSEANDNPYRRLLEFKGNIGKNERSHDIPEGRGMVMSNGVTFDLVDLMKGYDSFITGTIERKGSPRRNDDEFDLEDLVADEVDETPDALEADQDVDDVPEQEMVEDAAPEIWEEGEDEQGRPPKITISKSRTYGQVGTEVEIKSGESLIFPRSLISTPSSLIPHNSTSRSKYTFHTDYNPLTSKRIEVNDQDSINYQKMLHLTMHDLLSNLADKLDVHIIQRDEKGNEVKSKFDSTKTYTCI